MLSQLSEGVFDALTQLNTLLECALQVVDVLFSEKRAYRLRRLHDADGTLLFVNDSVKVDLHMTFPVG